MLGTKTINNIKVTLYGNPKQITENVSFRCFTYKTLKRMQTNKKLRNRITLPKRYILSVFEIVTYKKRENGWKALYIGKQKAPKSMLGTKMLNNMKVTLYGNPKQNYWKRVF